MGNALTSKPVLVTAGVAVGVAGSYVVSYISRKWTQEDPLRVLIEYELSNVDNASEDKAIKIAEIVHKYSKQYTKYSWRVNRITRRALFKDKNYSKYIATILEGFLTKKKAQESVRGIVLKKLKISKEKLNEILEEHKFGDRHYIDSLEGLNTTEPLTIKTAREILYERRRIEMEVDLATYVPESLEEKCEKIVGGNWRNVIKKFIVDDMLYETYSVTAEEAEEFLKKNESTHQTP